jgi:hypothetical protein
MHPLIKVPAIVGTILTVALLVASALASSAVPALVSIGTAGVTVLSALGQVVTVKKMGAAAKPPAPPAVKPAN